MSKELDDSYQTWLYQQVWSVRLRNPNRTYWSLIRQLHTTEFVWLIPNDDNRQADGRDLRYEFLAGEGLEAEDVDPNWMDLECSVLEMLIALSRRLSFEAEGEPRRWFWHLLENLGLAECNDSRYDPHYVSEVVANLILRNYSRSGAGGLFPLENPAKDQRSVEIWYQLNAYLMERDDGL